MQSLIFFNKEGDNLNFTYNKELEKWEGDLLFHENSDDTFKTIGLYTFEKLNSFEYENGTNLKLRKFQLFNEEKINFYGNSNFTQSITKIELPNVDSNFYSKWIYGEDFESKYPVGSQIYFNEELFEFTNPNFTYTVVSSKKGAIMILGNTDNKTFNENYKTLITSTSSYVNKTISGVNGVGFYNYLTSDLLERYSEWSEPNFYDKFYLKRKLNIVNTDKNDGIVSIKNDSLYDLIYYKYNISSDSVTNGSIFQIKINLRSDSPIVYSGGLKLNASKIQFSENIPVVFKPGQSFTIPSSFTNNIVLTVGDIPKFTGNTNVTFYQPENQVIWENKIYQCIQSYTWSATSSITPDDQDYWSRPKYLPVIQELTTENLPNAEIFLTSNIFEYTESYTQSSVITLSSFVEKYKEEFKLFNLDLYYSNNNLNVDLLYPSDYCHIEFKTIQNETETIYNKKSIIYENIVEVSQNLIPESNLNTNENHLWKTVFTDISDFGILVTINGQVYQQETVWVYESSKLNLQRTIDKTLRTWFERWFFELFTIGIRIKVSNSNPKDSVYYNSIILSSVYPNVGLNFDVEVGESGNFYIEHSEITFKDIGNFLNIIINDKSYSIGVTTTSTQNYDIKTTLSNWVDEYSEELQDFEIFVRNINTTLVFTVKSQSQRLEYEIKVGKSGLPSEELFSVNKKFFGKLGSLVTSNEIVLPGTWIKTTTYKNYFNPKTKMLVNISPFVLSDVPQIGDIGIEAVYDDIVDDITLQGIGRIAIREDNSDGDNISSWLSNIVGSVLTITSVDNPSYFVELNVLSLTATIPYPSTNLRRYTVSYINSNGTYYNVFNSSKVELSFVGENLKQPTFDVMSPTWSFLESDFAVGQVVGINNTVYPWNNQEYNLLNVGSQSLILDYRGPFWGTVEPKCDLSPFVIPAFEDGFEKDLCITITQSQIFEGEFDKGNFQTAFNLIYKGLNVYNSAVFRYLNTPNTFDIIYTDINQNLYLLSYELQVVDANLLSQTHIIPLDGIVNPKQLLVNNQNELLYTLSDYGIHVVDPRLNKVISQFTYSIPRLPKKIEINQDNGDLYLIYENSGLIQIWDKNNISYTTTKELTFSSLVRDIVYHEFEKDLYVYLADDTIQVIDGQNKQVNDIYQFNGLTGSLFYEPSESSIYIFDSVGLRKLNNGLSYSINVTVQDTNYFAYNEYLEEIVISQTNQLSIIKKDGTFVTNIISPNNGPVVFNPYDGDVYVVDNNQIKVIDSKNGVFRGSAKFTDQIQKIIYNPKRDSVIGIGVGLVEMKVELDTTITTVTPESSAVEDGMYGTLDSNYQQKENIWLKIREFIRKPRENFIGDVNVNYVWKWIDDQTPEIFLYDFSGNQLVSGNTYSYRGPKPLTQIRLSRNPNKDISKINDPFYQQTIFDEVINTLDFFDTDIVGNDFDPEPVELFIGYNSKNEGPTKSTLKLFKRESINFTITTTPSNLDIIQFSNRADGLLSIVLNLNSDNTFYFNEDGSLRGLKPGQILQVFVTDVTNTRNKYISNNNGIRIRLKYVFNKTLLGELIDRKLTDEFTVIENYPKQSKNTYLSVKFVVLDKEIGSFDVYGQTQIEDIRYKIELGNSGQLLSPKDIYIFKSYDINEQGIDWNFLNRKRKELLMVRDQIYSYIGSYKAIINSINYFGYNDLQLYEYYRNINSESKDFNKLFKIEIPDIFDNSVEGWTPNDFIKHTLPNPNFEDTNLFNLTFDITDKTGQNVLYYSLEEVLIKLQGLKKWLQSNVIPLTHKILDITGRADFVNITGIQHRNYDTRIINIRQNFSPYDFNLNEAYLMPVNSGSTVYTCHLDFFVADPIYASECFYLKIRTYQTYREWQPFRTYSAGDRVIYFEQIYESAIGENKMRNPRKFTDSPIWSKDSNYKLGDYVTYLREIYQYVGTQSSQETWSNDQPSPVIDIKTNQNYARWVYMTEWRKLDYTPIQTLTEFRTGTHSYNFTVDSNLDPFIQIELTSDNGYGQNYTNKKNYEIRGLKDLQDDPGKPDPMTGFNPIILIQNTSQFEPTLSISKDEIDDLEPLNSDFTLVTSDKDILSWEIVDKVLVNCLIYTEIEVRSKNTIRVKVIADQNSSFGTYQFRVRGYVTGNYFSETALIFGQVL
jgi:hypothetical protein